MSTVKAIHDLLTVAIQDAAAGVKLPDAFQFIAVDVPHKAQIDLPERIRYVNLAEPLTAWGGLNGVDSALMAGNRERVEDYLDWRNDPIAFKPNFAEGAGQFRLLGRAVGVKQLQEFGMKFEAAAQKCFTNTDQLIELAAKFGYAPTDDSIQSPMVVVISSLGGGAGSGIFLDICEMIRVKAQGNMAGLQQNLVAVLYDPSVFAKGGISLTAGGIPGNSYAAITELVAATVSPRKVSPLLAAGNPDIGQFNGPTFTFLVGVPGGGQAEGLSDIQSAYKNTARILTAWVTNTELSMEVSAWLANWDALMLKNGKGMLHEHVNGAPSRQPTTAFGYARLDLGRGRLQRFIIENLVRTALEEIATKHTTIDADGGEVNRDDVRAYVKANRHLVFTFLKSARLNENSVDEESNDEILNAIRLPELEIKLENYAAEIVKDFNIYRSLLTLENNVTSEIVSAEIKSLKDLHVARVVQWSKEIQDIFAWALADQVAVHGAWVLEEILEEAQQLMSVDFPAQLMAERDSGAIPMLLSEWDNRGRREEFKSSGKSITKEHKSRITALVKKRLEWQVERDLREIVAEVCRDVAKGLIGPAKVSISDLKEDLKQTLETESFRMLSDKKPSNLLVPTPNEMLIEEHTEWHGKMETLLRGIGKDLRQLALEIVRCSFIDRELVKKRAEYEGILPWESTQRWVPKISADLGDAASQPAVLRLCLSLDEVLGRTYGYFKFAGDNGNILISYCKASLEDYLEDQSISDAQRISRQTDFVERFKLALQKSEPMVEVKWDRVSNVYNTSKDKSLYWILSEFPLTGDVARRLRESLPLAQTKGGSEEPQSRNTHIEIFTTCAPMPPAYFFSLSQSIVNARNEIELARPSVTVDTFFRGRRTRPYNEFLPYSTSVKNTLARGWIIGCLTGRIRFSVSETPDVWKKVVRKIKFEDPISVIDSNGKEHRLLHRPVGAFVESEGKKFTQIALLTSVLNSGMLAEMSSVSQAQDSYLAAFQEIIKLGLGSTELASSEFGEIGDVITEWILKNTTDNESTLKFISDTADELERTVGNLRDAKASWNSKMANNPTTFEECPYEFLVADLYCTAASQISRALRETQEG